MSAAETATQSKPSRSRFLLGLVRALIDYGRNLATAFRSNPQPFGASDLAIILAHIARGLLRAEALEARIIRGAARLDAAPTARCAAARRRAPRARTAPRETCPATPEQIDAEVRRRPIGAVLADICRDLGIPPSHPLWRDLHDAIISFGGSLANLVKDLCDRVLSPCGSPWPLSTEPATQSPGPSGTDPP